VLKDCDVVGLRHDAGDAGVRVFGFPVAGEPRRADDVRSRGVGAPWSRRRLRQRQDLQEFRRPPLEEQHSTYLHGLPRVSTLNMMHVYSQTSEQMRLNISHMYYNSDVIQRRT
jgi:hypothetical protein